MEAKLFTLGIEEEFQLIDPETRALRSHVHHLLNDEEHGFGDQLKPELHQSVIEVGTRICANVYRFSPFEMSAEERGSLHARNERIHTATFLAGIRFYTSLIEHL